MKKFTTLVLSITILIGIFTVIPVSAKTSGKYEYKVLKNGTACITGYKGKDKNLTIPEKLGGYTVTEIGKKAFQYAFSKDFSINSVKLNKSMKKIGESAFEDSGLKKVIFNNKLTEIGKNAFKTTFMDSVNLKLPKSLKYLREGCFCDSEISKVDVPGSVKKIEAECFSVCKLDKVTLHKGLKEIGREAFSCNEQLLTIKLPSTLKKIGGGAFTFSSIYKIKLPKSLKTIEENKDEYPTFGEDLEKISVAKGNKYFKVYSNVLYNKKMTKVYVYPPERSRKNYKTPKTLKTIGKSAFYNAKLKKLTITKNVRKIKGYAFFNADMKSFKLEKGLKTIGTCAFYKANFSDDLYKLKLPDSVKKISYSAFEGSNISSVRLPAKLKEIKSQTFFGTFLSDIKIPKSVKKIGEAAFGYNEGECGIVGSIDKKFVVKGKKNSYAHKYAKKTGFKFKAV